MNTNMMPDRSAALKYMRDQQLEIRSDVPGYVIFFDGKPCGWSVQPRCADWRPGCIMVDLQLGSQFELVGGSYAAGGKLWQQLTYRS